MGNFYVYVILMKRCNNNNYNTDIKLISMIDNKGNKIDRVLKDQKLNIKKYPLDEINYEHVAQEKKGIIKKLLYLFVFYSGKASRNSYSELPEHYFMELMDDIWTEGGKKLIKNKGPWVDLQLLYYSKGCKNSLSFKHFLQILPTLAIYVEPNINREEALRSLMQQLVIVYQNKVLPNIDGKLVNQQIRIQDNTRQFLSKLAVDLNKLYKIYFTAEITGKFPKDQFKTNSFDNFMTFLKDFEVFPKILSARDAFYIFNQCCDAEQSQLRFQANQSRVVFSDLGLVFKWTKFIQSLILISKRVFPKLKQIQNQEQWETQQKYTLRTLLEYMQTTKTTDKKNTKFINQRFCFIVLDEHPQQQLMKTIQIEGRTRKQIASNMNFFNMLDTMKF